MIKKAPSLCDILNISHPIIMAPMFLVTNQNMMIAALNNGLTGCIPALNFRTDSKFREAISSIRKNSNGPIGVNLIVNKSNIKLKQQLKSCIELKIDYVITSLGNPKETIRRCQENNIKVFCDVTDLNYAKKVDVLGCDAIIAINSNAGGHCGFINAEILIPELIKNCKAPIISAGGVSNAKQIQNLLNLGACGVSVGSPFIATEESSVSLDYKQAVVTYGAKDIVLTEKLSGTPCTVINTPFVQSLDNKQHYIERLLQKNKKLKKLIKIFRFYTGAKLLKKSAFNTSYKTVWCAGPSIEGVSAIIPIAELVKQLTKE